MARYMQYVEKSLDPKQMDITQGKCVQQQTIRNKKVLLVANSSLLTVEILLHGINLSRRMDASLEVLHLLNQEPTDTAAKSFKENIAKLDPEEPVAYIQLVNDRGFTTETVEYAKNRRNIICVALCLEAQGTPRKKGTRQRRLNEVTRLLNCPVVLYTDSPLK